MKDVHGEQPFVGFEIQTTPALRAIYPAGVLLAPVRRGEAKPPRRFAPPLLMKGGEVHWTFSFFLLAFMQGGENI
jgi:hypothetical protein